MALGLTVMILLTILQTPIRYFASMRPRLEEEEEEEEEVYDFEDEAMDEEEDEEPEWVGEDERLYLDMEHETRLAARYENRLDTPSFLECKLLHEHDPHDNPTNWRNNPLKYIIRVVSPVLIALSDWSIVCDSF